MNVAFLAPTAVELVTKRLRFNPVEEDQDFDSSDDDIYVSIVNKCSPMFASGAVLSSIMLDGVLTSAFRHPELIMTLKALCASGQTMPDDNTESSHLRFIVVPDEFVDKTFGTFYKFLTRQHGIIPLGIQRNMKSEQHRNSLPYVLTNPLWCFILLKSDFVYVLANNVKFL